MWSATRRYPGLTTQSAKAQYASRLPDAADYPEWPTGEQVQAWLAAYASLRPRRGALDRGPRRPADGDGWSSTSAARPKRSTGWSWPTAFLRAGRAGLPGRGRVRRGRRAALAGTELHDAEDARGKHVVVVGYGKSACDVTVPVSEVAASTDVIARQLLWKVPRKIGGFLNFKMLLLTRMGEALFRYMRPRGRGEVPARPGQRHARAR